MTVISRPAHRNSLASTRNKVSSPHSQAPSREAQAAKEAFRNGDLFDDATGHSREAELPKVAAMPADNAGPAKLIRHSEVKLDVPNASGLVALGDGQFIVVDDKKGIYLANHKGHSKKLESAKDHDGLRDLEGICLAPDGQQVLSLSEQSGTIMAFNLKRKDSGKIKLGKAKALGQLPQVGRVHNKGWEGMTILPGRFSPDGEARLLAVVERSPRRVGVFRYPSLEQESLLKLPKAAKKAMSDMSDIAVCPQTGHVFILSDESQSLVELRLNLRHQHAPGAMVDLSSLEVLGQHKLDFAPDEKTEGLSFDGAGRLYVATDERNRLVAYDVVRNDK